MDYKKWELTYRLTPNQANILKSFPDCEEGYFTNQDGSCRLIKPKIEISEINYASPKKNQFIELYNAGNITINLNGYTIKTNLNASYKITKDIKIKPGQYIAFFQQDTKINFNNQFQNTVSLISFDNNTIVDNQTFDSLSLDKTWAKSDSQWDWTFKGTPNLVNIISHKKECNSGYHWNEKLEKCSVNTIKNLKNNFAGMGGGKNTVKPEKSKCKDGYEMGYTGTCVKKCGLGEYRSKDTNRCRKYSVIALKTKSKKVPNIKKTKQAKQKSKCKDGYEMGYTGTCVKECKTGYERNKDTNHCRKKPEKFTKLDKKILETAFKESKTKPKFNLLKLVDNPFFGALVGASVIYVYSKFGKK